MRRLAARMACLALLVATAYLAVLALPVKRHLVYSSSVDKHRRLESLGSPKLVLVGGSSLALGVDSALLQARVGVPVVNMGLNGGLGLRFMCAEVTPFLGEGDLVIVSPEYGHWHGRLLEGSLNLLWVLRVNPAAVAWLSSPRQLATIVTYAPEFMQGKLQEFLSTRRDPVYSRQSFNEFGDFVGHIGQPRRRPLVGLVRMRAERANAETGSVLKALAIAAGRRKARVMYSFPPLAREAYAYLDNRAAIDDIAARLERIPEVVVIDPPERRVFQDDVFYDSVYHLTAEGRRLRTERVIAEVMAAGVPSRHSGS